MAPAAAKVSHEGGSHEGSAVIDPRVLFVAAIVGLAAGPAVAQTAIPPTSLDFAQAAAQSDEYELLAARTALAESRNARIKDFAQHMVDAHTRMADRLRQAIQASSLPAPPPALSGDQSRMLSALQSLRGDDFDKTYIRQQVVAHSQALAVERSYAGAGTDPNLRTLAQSSVLLTQEHLRSATEIRAALGGG